MIRRLWHRLLGRPGIQRHTVPPLSEYVDEERQILDDYYCQDRRAEVERLDAAIDRLRDRARAALDPDSLPFFWPDHDPDDEYCECRGCHVAELGRFTGEEIGREFDDIVRTELGDVRARARRWSR